MAVQVRGFLQPIAQLDAHRVARLHAERRSYELALVGVAPDLRTCHIESRRLNVECGLQQTVLGYQLGRRLRRADAVGSETLSAPHADQPAVCHSGTGSATPSQKSWSGRRSNP